MEKSHIGKAAEPVVVSPASHARPRGKHRVPAPPNALRGRASVLAVAAGAAVSAGSVGTYFSPSEAQSTASGEIALLANGEVAAPGTSTTSPSPTTSATSAVSATPSAPEPVVVEAAESPQESIVSTLFAGTEINAQREISEEQARRPKVALPAIGTFTSEFGMRWGVLHGGIDIANAPDTPEFAATDGTVIDAGPAQGFGNWVRIMSDDGVMTVYGHMNTVLVQKGQRVMAGQQIALMGSRGFSTGSHLHFEVWIDGGKTRTDPRAWLAQNGVVI